MKKFFKAVLIILFLAQGLFIQAKAIESNNTFSCERKNDKLNPTISITGNLQVFTACLGSASQSQSFDVEGEDLTDDIIITAPSGYEISTDNSTWGTSAITLQESSGVVDITTIYIRIVSSTTSINNSNSNITIVSGSTSENIPLSGYILSSSSIVPGTISGNQTFCGSGNPSTIGSSNNGNDGLSNVSSTLSYRWEESTNNINWVTITGENSNTYSPPNLSVTTYYRRSLRVKVGNNSACLSAPSNVVTVTVNNNFSVTAGPDIVVCKGQSINLTAIGSGTTDIITYQWSGPNGFSSNSQNPTISNATVVRSGNYTVRARISSDCSVTDVVNVLVIDEPSIINEELVVCITEPGQNTGYASFQLNIPSNTSHILNYTVDWGDGSTIEQYNNTNWNNTIYHEYGIGISNFIITLNSTNGCSISKQFSVFVGSSPSSATLVLNQNQANGCAPLTTTWTLTIPDNIVGTYYSCDWGEPSNQDDFIFNQGGNVPANTSTMTWSAPSINPTTLVTTYTITKTFLNSSCGNNVILGQNTYYNAYQPVVITQNPCTTTPQPSGTGLVTIGKKPTANFTPEPFPTKICIGVPLQLNNTSNFGQTIPTNSGAECTTAGRFYWSITPLTNGVPNSWTVVGSLGSSPNPTSPWNIWTSGSMSPIITFNQPGNYRITLTIGNTCGVDTISKEICVQSKVTPVFSLDTNEGCKPFVVTATNNSDTSVSCSNTTYEWNVSYTGSYCGTTSSFSYVNNTTNTSANPVFQFNNSGTYQITITTTNDCGSLTSATQTVIVKQPPTVSINTISDYCGTATISPVAVVNSCAPATSNLTYLW
ncbi:MAG: PKD domain-containing protein, partial [Dolichospermum sp.]